jgi:hypothetical protein
MPLDQNGMNFGFPVATPLSNAQSALASKPLPSGVVTD